jgi:hypothetical protein
MGPKPELEFEVQNIHTGSRNKRPRSLPLPTLTRALLRHLLPRHLFGSYFPWQKRE